MDFGGYSPTLVWVVFAVIFMIGEIATVGLTCIWFAGGSLLAALAAGMGAPVWLQVIVFFGVSIVLLLGTRPFVKKYVNDRRVNTNYENAIGKTVRITEKVDNIDATGTALLNGQEWTARMEKEDETLNPGDLAKVVRIEGVKLIVTRATEEDMEE